VEVVPTRPEHAEALEALQKICFPTLADAQRMKAAHYRAHIAMFPEGQLCVVDGARVIGSTTTIRLDFDFAHPDHRFDEIFQGGWLTSHQPAGRWLYGADMETHPDYRGRGVARALYEARKALVQRLGLDGQVTVGSPSGYGAVAAEVGIDEYVADVVAKRRRDPTLSMQLGFGFEPRGVIASYLDDPGCGDYGVLLVLPRS
jgi:GNAT superfamily N-acetyltransferase